MTHWPSILLGATEEADDDKAIIRSVDLVDDRVGIGGLAPSESILRATRVPDVQHAVRTASTTETVRELVAAAANGHTEREPQGQLRASDERLSRCLTMC